MNNLHWHQLSQEDINNCLRSPLLKEKSKHEKYNEWFEKRIGSWIELENTEIISESILKHYTDYYYMWKEFN